jgi:hypothetical protein
MGSLIRLLLEPLHPVQDSRLLFFQVTIIAKPHSGVHVSLAFHNENRKNLYYSAESVNKKRVLRHLLFFYLDFFSFRRMEGILALLELRVFLLRFNICYKLP